MISKIKMHSLALVLNYTITFSACIKKNIQKCCAKLVLIALLTAEYKSPVNEAYYHYYERTKKKSNHKA